MCIVDHFLCCFKLKTGMYVICLCYLIYFTHFVLERPSTSFGNEFASNKYIEDWNYYYLAGLITTACALIGLTGEKKTIFFIPLLLFDSLILISKSVEVSSVMKENDGFIPQYIVTLVMLLLIKMYCIMIQYSYIVKSDTVQVVFSSVPSSATTIVVTQPRIAQPMPNIMEYSQQPLYPMPQPQNSSLQQCYWPQMSSTIQNNNAYPTPYDPPPPYTEDMKASAPPL